MNQHTPMKEMEKAKELFIQGLKNFLDKEYELAQANFEEALIYSPGRVSVLINLCSTQIKLGQLESAANLVKKILDQDINNAEAWLNRGFIFKEQNNLVEAVESFSKAIQIDSNYYEAYLNRGVAYRELGNGVRALENFNQCIALNPENSLAFYHAGLTLQDEKNYVEALKVYQIAYQLDSGLECLIGNMIHCKQHSCDWTDILVWKEQINIEIQNGNNPVAPFTMLGIIDSLEMQHAVAKNWAKANFFETRKKEQDLEAPHHLEKIVIAYISGDFSKHAVGILTAGLFERHDRAKFHIIGLSTAKLTGDRYQQKIASGLDQFIDVSSYTDELVLELCKNLKLDIAIDLSGYTKGGRTAIFAKRIAPIQINYLGYPGTMGAKYYDYLIADEILIKPGEERFYSEKIIYMPDSYQVNDQDRKIYSPIDNRKFWNLPENETVYCCFNNNYKISEFTFKAWMRILKEVPKSVLWLLKDNELVVANLRNQAEKNGVDGQRIIFAKRVDFDAHIERQKFADLFLDTLPYNAHTTASDALWVGVPLITLGGNTFASRVASSLLMAIEMPELIASSLADYEQMAIEIGRSPQKISALKERLVDKIFEAPLFDTDKFVRNLENAFLEIYSRFSKQLPPDHIKVQKLCKS